MPFIIHHELFKSKLKPVGGWGGGFTFDMLHPRGHLSIFAKGFKIQTQYKAKPLGHAVTIKKMIQNSKKYDVLLAPFSC
jgi:hypothetical protein